MTISTSFLRPDLKRLGKTLPVCAVLLWMGGACLLSPASGGTRPVQAPSNVAILLQKPQRPYQVLATIKTDNYRDAFPEISYDALRKEAAKLGADAVIVVKTTPPHLLMNGNAAAYQDPLVRQNGNYNPNFGGVNYNPNLHTGAPRQVNGVMIGKAIRYTDGK